MWRRSIPLARLASALASTIATAWLPATAQEMASSPLGSFPARFEYVSNNAPFVVFDIAPRTLNAAAAIKSFKELTLSFVATEPLHHVDVYTSVSSAGGDEREVPTRIACGSTIAGHYDCQVPTREALLLLKEKEGSFGLRIEAEGIEGERSTVRITLPVKIGAARPTQGRVVSPLPLTPLTAPLSNR